MLRLLFRFRAEGWEDFPENGGCILASNHMSFLDPVVLGMACPRQLCFLARADLFSGTSRFFSWLLTRVNAYPLKRGEGDPVAMRTALRLLKEGRALVIFPEGTRSPDGSLRRGSPGLGMLALKTGVPIVPALIVGTERALPRGAKFIHPAKIAVYFGERIFPRPAETGAVKKQEYQAITDLVMDRIAALKPEPGKER